VRLKQYIEKRGRQLREFADAWREANGDESPGDEACWDDEFEVFLEEVEDDASVPAYLGDDEETEDAMVEVELADPTEPTFDEELN